MWPRPANLTGPLKLGAVKRSIVGGVPGTLMPAFNTLSGPRLEALVTFVATLGPKVAPAVIAPPRPALLPDARVGATLWTTQGCAACHAGSALDLAELADLFDVFTRPLKGGDALEDLFITISQGRPGTPMRARPDLSVEDRWALAVYIRSRRQTIDATLRLPPAGANSVSQDRLWASIPTPALSSPLPILQSRRAAQCGRCHPKTHAEWSASRHAMATGPGLVGQYPGQPPTFARGCDRCHAPQAQGPSDSAHADGVSCVGCHVRGAGKLAVDAGRDGRGPPGIPLRVEPRLARSDFCMPCHNLPLSAAVAGRPLLDTWREWAQSPYLPAGVQCQTCHLGQGDHRMVGAHDPDTVRRAVEVRVDQPRVDGDAVVMTVRIRNIGAGHHFPTTATPRAVLRVRQIRGTRRLNETSRLWAIGRTVAHDAQGWREIEDTRIPAGDTLTRTYRVALADGVDAIEADVHFFPDWFYTRIFRGQLMRNDLATGPRAAFEQALADGQGSVIRVDWQVQPILR
ncbi:MAG: hypothetical protein ACI9U2_003945 [Bradymonadia bacterium]|jgi:hypothetical protein